MLCRVCGGDEKKGVRDWEDILRFGLVGGDEKKGVRIGRICCVSGWLEEMRMNGREQ